MDREGGAGVKVVRVPTCQALGLTGGLTGDAAAHGLESPLQQLLSCLITTLPQALSIPCWAATFALCKL